MSWGAVGGSVAGVAAGALLGGGRSGGAGTQGSTFTPDFTSNSGLFNTSLNKTGKRTKNGNVTYRDSTIRGSISNPTLRNVNSQGLHGAKKFLNRSRNGENAQFFEDEGLRFLEGLGATDPQQVAQDQFNLLNPILQDQQNQDFLGQEQRLFAQGRLGGAGELSGQSQQNALFDSFADQERKLLFDSLDQGLQAQQQQFNLGTGLTNLGGAQRSNDFNLGQGFLQIPLALQQAMMNQQQIAAGIAGGGGSQTTGPSFNPVQTVGAGLINSGVQGLTNTANDFFGGFGGQDFSAFRAGNNNINGNINTVGK